MTPEARSPKPRFFRRIVGRVFHCHLCPGRFAGHEGVTQLRWLLLFFFCNRCWTDRRQQCESLMADACALPTRSVAGPSARTGASIPSSAPDLPSSIENQKSKMVGGAR